MGTNSLFYKHNIAEGKGILVFSVIIAIIIRLAFFLSTDDGIDKIAFEGYLGKTLNNIFASSLLSFIASSVIVGLLAFLAAHINTVHVLIRRRSLLPPAIIILLFSCHREFTRMSSAYLGALCILFVVFILFSVYNSNDKPLAAFRVAFTVSIGSIFAPALLVYIPLCWLALTVVRCFSFKSLLATLFAFFMVYFPIFSYYIFSEQLDVFYAPFLSIFSLKDMPIYRFDNIIWGGLAFFVLLSGIIIGNNYINRYKDKIKTRAYLALLSLTTIISMLFYLFINIGTQTNLYISLATGSLLLSHFFALIEDKKGRILFYTIMFIYFTFCVLFYGNIL